MHHSWNSRRLPIGLHTKLAVIRLNHLRDVAAIAVIIVSQQGPLLQAAQESHAWTTPSKDYCMSPMASHALLIYFTSHAQGVTLPNVTFC